MKLSVHWLWYDLWVGLFYDRAKRVVYFCPLPTIVFKLELGQ